MMGDEVCRAKCIVSGVVQGVGYRKWCKRTADQYDVSGSVQNRDDYTVLVYVQGKKQQVLKFIEMCKKGPEVADVEHIQVTWQAHVPEETTFRIV